MNGGTVCGNLFLPSYVTTTPDFRHVIMHMRSSQRTVVRNIPSLPCQRVDHIDTRTAFYNVATRNAPSSKDTTNDNARSSFTVSVPALKLPPQSHLPPVSRKRVPQPDYSTVNKYAILENPRHHSITKYQKPNPKRTSASTPLAPHPHPHPPQINHT